MYHVRQFDDVHILKLETPLSRALSYATYVPWVDGLLFDSGFVRARKDLKRALGERRVEQVANTHAHEDHFGNNTWLSKTFEAQVYAPEASLEDMLHPERVAARGYQRRIWGIPEVSRARPLGGTIETGSYRFDVIATPGHSADHVSFFEPEQGWLFSGDLFLSYKVRIARPFENANDLISSLERVRELKPSKLFCYHRGYVAEPDQALETKIDFMKSLRDGVRNLSEHGLSPREIAKSVLGKDPIGYVFTDFSKQHLVEAFLKEPGEGYDLAA